MKDLFHLQPLSYHNAPDFFRAHPAGPVLLYARCSEQNLKSPRAAEIARLDRTTDDLAGELKIPAGLIDIRTESVLARQLRILVHPLWLVGRFWYEETAKEDAPPYSRFQLRGREEARELWGRHQDRESLGGFLREDQLIPSENSITASRLYLAASPVTVSGRPIQSPMKRQVIET